MRQIVLGLALIAVAGPLSAPLAAKPAPIPPAIFTDPDLLEEGAEEGGTPPADPSLDAEKLKAHLERMDPEDFGKFQP